jgi:hypothetical protein
MGDYPSVDIQFMADVMRYQLRFFDELARPARGL